MNKKELEIKEHYELLVEARKVGIEVVKAMAASKEVNNSYPNPYLLGERAYKIAEGFARAYLAELNWKEEKIDETEI